MQPLFGLHLALIFILNVGVGSPGNALPENSAVNIQDEESLKYIRRKRSTDTNSAPEFSSHSIIQPKLYHVSDKHEVDIQNLNPKRENRKGKSVEDLNDLTVSFTSRGQDYVIDLRLNHQLIPHGYFQKYHEKVILKIIESNMNPFSQGFAGAFELSYINFTSSLVYSNSTLIFSLYSLYIVCAFIHLSSLNNLIM